LSFVENCCSLGAQVWDSKKGDEVSQGSAFSPIKDVELIPIFFTAFAVLFSIFVRKLPSFHADVPQP